MNNARRRRILHRRLSRAGRLALAGLTVALLGMLLLSIGFALPGGLLLALAVTIGFRAPVTGCPWLRAQQSRRSLGGGGTARAGPTQATWMAAATWTALAGPRGHRLGSDCADRGRIRHRFLPLIWSLRVPFVRPPAPQDPLFSARVSVRLACCS